MTESTRRPLSRMRASIAKSMSASALVPQFTVEMDADLGSLAEWRARREDRPSYADVVVAACARALVDHPQLNASFADDAILEHAVRNIGVGIALPDGLIAPAIRDADALELTALTAERRRLTAAAESGRLTPEDMFSATFTVSNLGPLGVRRFRALVVPPQAAILALGALTASSAMSLSLSCDHRVVDGAPAARFLGDVVERLQAPAWLDDL
jgi:pyruvate dehydrogenase E2 component (dihydrolipoamide acetyltransferase)